MNTTITLDETHFKTVADKARVLGKTPDEYVKLLIEADNRTIDEILEPIREGFSDTSDEELDGMLERARRAARQSGK